MSPLLCDPPQLPERLLIPSPWDKRTPLFNHQKIQMRNLCNAEMHCRCHLAGHLDLAVGLFDLNPHLRIMMADSTWCIIFNIQWLIRFKRFRGRTTPRQCVLLSFLRPLHVYRIYYLLLYEWKNPSSVAVVKIALP